MPRRVCALQTVIIDGRAHMLGRLASIVAKQLLAGHHLVSARSQQPRSQWAARSQAQMPQRAHQAPGASSLALACCPQRPAHRRVVL